MNDAPELDVAMVAGETSGDLLASLVIPGMQLRWPGLRMCGIGGPRMQGLGFTSWWPMEKLSVRGYVEALPGNCGHQKANQIPFAVTAS